MWTLSKPSSKCELSYAELESLVLQRTVALQKLSQQLLKVQDEERRKVARDLHDSTGQTLIAIKLNIELLKGKLKDDPGTFGFLSDIAALADQALQEIRTTSYLLHPPLLDELGFVSAAQWFVEGFAKRSGMKVRLDLARERERLPITIETALFRVLQEGLTNVHRHSGAAEVEIRFHRKAGAVILEIRDSGCGIPRELLNRLGGSSETGVGLVGMRERVTELNGTFELQSNAQGTCLRAIVPVPVLVRPVQLIDFGQVDLSAQACEALPQDVA